MISICTSCSYFDNPDVDKFLGDQNLLITSNKHAIDNVLVRRGQKLIFVEGGTSFTMDPEKVIALARVVLELDPETEYSFHIANFSTLLRISKEHGYGEGITKPEDTVKRIVA
jgi:hypothetical protein